ncbi:non-ribosomal peptide synthetase [Leptolyngbya sp. FACHB-711]|uniref:non-ribosomal peptide synthetase n=1 Tax=Leptolyngbya sp. FACHB-711 TaxID=2692813 RepID=UPI0018EF92DA|nr:non-ribosomal peptide synthetase [Leptolyngbya sp. FACHB-711]
MSHRSIAEFLAELQRLDVQLAVVESPISEGLTLSPRLRCNAPTGVLTSELRQQLIDRKAEIINFLQHNLQQDSQPDSQPDFQPGLQPDSQPDFQPGSQNIVQNCVPQTLSQSIPLNSSETVFPLSFAQQRLWFLYQIAPDNPFYNVPAAIRLTGSLNCSVLERSFNEIVRRHAALRTTFTTANREPVQVVEPEARITIPVVDLRSSLQKTATQTIAPSDAFLKKLRSDREHILQQFITAEAQRPFNLSTDLPMRVTLLQFDESEAILLLTLHHIVADGWSLGVLIRELAELYQVGIQGRSAALAPLPIQYADFACWQRQWLQGEVLENQLAYWRKQLQDVSRLDLPIDRPRPAMQTYRGATFPLRFSPTLTGAIEALCQQEGVSLFMTLLAAFQTLLHRYTGQTDIAIGSPIANRHRSEFEELIGFFVNSLVMRSDLSGNPTFRELLGRVRNVALEAYQHQDLPFEKLVEELDPERDLSGNPLFQVAFALQNAPMQPLELPGVRLEPVPLEPQTTRFDLEVHLWQPSHGLSSLWQSEAGLSGFISYSTDLFDRATIHRFVEHFQTLLHGIVANPDARLSDLPLLTPAEHQQLVVKWNQTATEFLNDRSFYHFGFHHLFERQANQFPERIALVTESESLSYAELNDRADRLANTLKQIGAQPNDLVGLCVDRSADLIIGILGILKTGAAYVPIDPSYPTYRIEFILTDTQMNVLLTQSWLRETLPRSQAQIICLDQPLAVNEKVKVSVLNSNLSRPFNPSILEGTDLEGTELDDSDAQSSPTLEDLGGNSPFFTRDSLAYVIYTSGSTGTPKGVLITHRGLCNVVAAQRQAFDLPADSSSKIRVLQFSSLSFDASVFEIALAIGSGGTLYIPPQSVQLPGAALVRFLQDHAITHALLTPAVLAVLPSADLPALQTLITGGEACPRPVIDRWAANRRFFNAYGPTETTIWATVAELCPGDAPLIGRPVANMQVYVLDDALQPVPIGVVGELYIGGAGVARGYLNRPELASRFISSPFEANPFDASLSSSGARLYRTGDRVRYRADGNLEFCGRSDDQIKIRGFRVEPGEIETALQSHPAVQEAIVLATGEASHAKRLLAYFSLTRPLIFNAGDSNSGSTQSTPGLLQAQQIQHWQTLYNQTYRSPDRPADPAFNITGWNSSYTGEPIPAAQMREWVDDRVQQILALHPKQVLEIGCGTGLLLFQIAPHCEAYWGIDFSTVSLETVQRQVNDRGLSQVKLLHRSAADFEGVASSAFDAVILNSVVQYFPDVDYLMQVIAGAIEAVRPGGTVFLGDVRSLPLLKAFHAWVGLSQADETTERTQLRQQVERSQFEESELAIDPAFFYALRDAFPRIHRVQIRLARGRSHNEMTQFRYNVLLHIGQHDLSENEFQFPEKKNCFGSPLQQMQWIDWKTQKITVSDTQKYLLEHQPDRFGVRNIANARVDNAVQTAEWLSSKALPKTVGKFREKLQNSVKTAIDPQDWWDLEKVLPYQVEISWSSDSQAGTYDVVLIRNEIRNDIKNEIRNGIASEVNFATHSPLNSPIHSRTIQQNNSSQDLSQNSSWHRYTNNPLQSQVARQLIPELRAFLGQALPDYMIPTAFVPLETLPLTPNGKIDRAALLEQNEFDWQSLESTPSPNLLANDASQTPTELALIDIWKELLRLQQIHIHDSFFELGGHSLLATQMTSRIRDRFEVELPLRRVFETPTIAQLAPAIDRLRDSTLIQSPPIGRLERSVYRWQRSKRSESDFQTDTAQTDIARTDTVRTKTERLAQSSTLVSLSSNYQYSRLDQSVVAEAVKSEAVKSNLEIVPRSNGDRLTDQIINSNFAKARSPLVPLTVEGNRYRPGSVTRSPFFCVHPIFGVVFPYLELAQLLETSSAVNRSFYGLQPLGLDGKHLPFNRIEAMAAYYITAMRAVQPHGPYFLGGWSFGGLVAFEMAQQLTQAGETVALLAILDTPAPLAHQQPSLVQSLKFLLKTALWSTLPFLLDYGAIVTNRFPVLNTLPNALPQSQRWKSWYSRWQWSAITRLMPDARLRLQDESAIVPLMRIFYANSQAAYRYMPHFYPGSVTLFKATNPSDYGSSDPTLGWSQLCDRVQVHSVPGNHLSMLKLPHVQVLAQQLQAYLS